MIEFFPEWLMELFLAQRKAHDKNHEQCALE